MKFDADPNPPQAFDPKSQIDANPSQTGSDYGSTYSTILVDTIMYSKVCGFQVEGKILC